MRVGGEPHADLGQSVGERPVDAATDVHGGGPGLDTGAMAQRHRVAAVRGIAVDARHPVQIELEEADVHAQLVADPVHLVGVLVRHRRRVARRVERVVRGDHHLVEERRGVVEVTLEAEGAVGPGPLVGVDLGL